MDASIPEEPIEDASVPAIDAGAVDGEVQGPEDMDANIEDPPDAEIFEPYDAGPPPPRCDGPTGLYRDGSCTVLAADVREYRPKYELWSDGADKFRHIYLPPGTQIDTADPDRWRFPVGTRLYKTFVQRGVRIETRLIEKTAPAASVESWTMKAFAWSADQMSVTEAPPEGVQNALGTDHDIPSQANCRSCHTMNGRDAVNGFGALQLNHLAAGVSLGELLERQLLMNSQGLALPTVAEAHFPGDARAQNALGYLHANCGHCHGGPTPRANLQLWTKYETTSVSNAPIFMGGSSPADDGDTCACLTNWVGRTNFDGQPYERRVVPGHAEISGIIGRMSVRTGLPRPAPLPPVPAREQMPPLGTEFVDVAGVITVSNWINSLELGSCDPTITCPAPPPPAPPPMMTTPPPPTP